MKRLVAAPVRFYRRYLSGLKRAPTCRFVPTCSEYALEAIEKRGALVGTLKALWRILRCNPLFRGGYDPVERDRAEDHRHAGCGHAADRRPGHEHPVAGHP
ncbi:MAG TPA: membrane protein insertion efficiency factor YidD [Kofleriaceae bacterium]|nr:membrane protein insertion efficiency factor YidD [Kofleriaceae bacterium]